MSRRIYDQEREDTDNAIVYHLADDPRWANQPPEDPPGWNLPADARSRLRLLAMILATLMFLAFGLWALVGRAHVDGKFHPSPPSTTVIPATRL